ncbi:MAG: methyltransferase [Prosthecochloris sp.]|nr:methyltransferase [Prosthecochloris sp.]
MNNQKKRNNPWWHGKKGEHLVLLQFLILVTFVILPEWRPGSLHNMQAVASELRLGILAVCGLLALLFGGLGSHTIREYVTPLPYPVDHNELVQHGIYAYVRHPLYSSQLIAGLGWCIYTLSLSHLLLLAVAFLFFDVKASKEELWLTERHPEYRTYAAKVKKFIPWVY